MKIVAMILSLITSSIIGGYGLALNYAIVPKPHSKANTSLYMTAGDPRESNDVAMAKSEMRIDDLVAMVKEDRDDRKIIHDEIASLADRELNHYNLINDRLNVSDAKFAQTEWIFGGLLTVFNALGVYFHFDGKMRRNRRSTDGKEDQA